MNTHVLRKVGWAVLLAILFSIALISTTYGALTVVEYVSSPFAQIQAKKDIRNDGGTLIRQEDASIQVYQVFDEQKGVVCYITYMQRTDEHELSCVK